MPVIKKPRYVAQIKGERRSPFFFFPLLLPSPSFLFSLLSSFFFITGCGLFHGSGQIYFRRDSRKNELADREMQMRSWYRLAPLEKWILAGVLFLWKKTRRDSLKWLVNLPSSRSIDTDWKLSVECVVCHQKILYSDSRKYLNSHYSKFLCIYRVRYIKHFGISKHFGN